MYVSSVEVNSKKKRRRGGRRGRGRRRRNNSGKGHKHFPEINQKQNKTTKNRKSINGRLGKYRVRRKDIAFCLCFCA